VSISGLPRKDRSAARLRGNQRSHLSEGKPKSGEQRLSRDVPNNIISNAAALRAPARRGIQSRPSPLTEAIDHAERTIVQPKHPTAHPSPGAIPPFPTNDKDHGAAVIDFPFKSDDAGRSRASFCSSTFPTRLRLLSNRSLDAEAIHVVELSEGKSFYRQPEKFAERNRDFFFGLGNR